MGIPTTSQVFSTRAIKEEAPFINWSTPQFIQAIKTIAGSADVAADITLKHDAKYTLLYLVQTLIVYYNKNIAVDPIDAYDHARKCSLAFQADNAIAISLEDGYEHPDDQGNTARSGSKVDVSRSIFREYFVEGQPMSNETKSIIRKRFVDELDMTKPAARTYFRNAEMHYLGK